MDHGQEFNAISSTGMFSYGTDRVSPQSDFSVSLASILVQRLTLTLY